MTNRFDCTEAIKGSCIVLEEVPRITRGVCDGNRTLISNLRISIAACRRESARKLGLP